MMKRAILSVIIATFVVTTASAQGFKMTTPIAPGVAGPTKSRRPSVPWI